MALAADPAAPPAPAARPAHKYLELLVAVMMGNYAVVGWLKRTEHEDWYDRDTDFSPFTLKQG